MNLKKVILTVAVVLVSAFPPVACAGSLTTEVIGMFPRDVGEFAYVDLRQARYLSWFSELQKQVLPDPLRQFEQLSASAGMAPNSQVEELAWAVIPEGLPAEANASTTNSGEIVSVALGQFSPESADAYFKAQKRAVIKVRDYSLYAFGGGSGDGGLFFCFMDSSTVVLGRRKELEKLIAVQYGEEQSLLSNTELAPLISQVNSGSVVWAVLSAPYARRAMQQLTPQAAEFPESQQLFSTVHALTLELGTGSGIQTRFEAVCASPDDANIFAALLQADLLYQRYQARKSNQDLTELLEQAKVAPSGDRLDMTLALSDDQVMGLIQRNALLFVNK